MSRRSSDRRSKRDRDPSTTGHVAPGIIIVLPLLDHAGRTPTTQSYMLTTRKPISGRKATA